MKKTFHRIVLICLTVGIVLIGLTSCTDYVYFLPRVTVWDTAEVFVLNFRAGELTVELAVGEETKIVTVESFHEEYRHIHRNNNQYHVWKPGQFPDSVYVEEWNLNPYDTSELEPVSTYRHAEGPESLTSIRIFDGESLLLDIPFDGRQADGKGTLTDEIWWTRELPTATVERMGKTRLGYYDSTNLPIKDDVDIMLIIEWEQSSERVEAEDLFSDFCIRLDDLTNPRIYILVGEGPFQGHTGPAGGMVFYENPNWEADGWRYLEAAPEDWHEGASDSLPWGGRGISVGETDMGVGTGKDNTQAIITFWEEWRRLRIDNPNHSDDYTEGFNYSDPDVQAHLAAGRIPLRGTLSNNPSEWTWIEQYAAMASAEYSVTVDGVTYDDWFLPSADELDLMLENLRMHGLGSFASAWFWSSSELPNRHDDNVWSRAFGDHYSVPLGSGYGKARVSRVRPIRAY